MTYSACRRAGSVLGLIIGAIFVQYANWSWVFWFVALVALPISAICCFLVPSPHRAVDDLPTTGRWRTLDLGGVSVLTGQSSRVEAFLLCATTKPACLHSCHDPLHICRYIGIYSRMGFGHGACAAHHLHCDGGRLLLV